MAVYAAVAGVLLEPLGEVWAAYSPLSGETVLLNDTSAAMLEVLSGGALDSECVCALLAADTGQEQALIRDVVDGCWMTLVSAGLVRASMADAQVAST